MIGMDVMAGDVVLVPAFPEHAAVAGNAGIEASQATTRTLYVVEFCNCAATAEAATGNQGVSMWETNPSVDAWICSDTPPVIATVTVTEFCDATMTTKLPKVGVAARAVQARARVAKRIRMSVGQFLELRVCKRNGSRRVTLKIARSIIAIARVKFDYGNGQHAIILSTRPDL